MQVYKYMQCPFGCGNKMKVTDKQQWTHRGQRQAKVGGLVFHLDLNFMKQSLNLFLLKAIPVNDDKDKWLKLKL